MGRNEGKPSRLSFAEGNLGRISFVQKKVRRPLSALSSLHQFTTMDNNSSSSTESSTSTHTENITQPANLTSSSFQSSSRKSPFLGFADNSKQDEYLVQALTVHNPFKADHGEKGVTWDRVLGYLKAIDEVGARRGQVAMLQVLRPRPVVVVGRSSSPGTRSASKPFSKKQGVFPLRLTMIDASTTFITTKWRMTK